MESLVVYLEIDKAGRCDESLDDLNVWGEGVPE
jgi:hypothetical protein